MPLEHRPAPCQPNLLATGKPMPESNKVAIIGSGLVGSTFAYTLMLHGLASEIVLVDVNKAKAEGDAMDLNHGMALTHPVTVYAGDYEDCADAAVVVIAAGVSQRPGETRLDLLKRNVEVFRAIINELLEHAVEGIILVATNPVDVLTYATLRMSGLPEERVIGSGTILDTARLRYELGEHLKVDPRSVHAYVIGEHGDSELAVWSLANIAGIKLRDFCPVCGREYQLADLEGIFERVRNAAYEIIERKGATYYGIAAGLMRIVQSILRNERSILTVSTYVEDYYGVSDICIGVPAVIDRTGVAGVIKLALSPDEQRAFARSAQTLKEAARSIGF